MRSVDHDALRGDWFVRNGWMRLDKAEECKKNNGSNERGDGVAIRPRNVPSTICTQEEGENGENKEKGSGEVNTT